MTLYVLASAIVGGFALVLAVFGFGLAAYGFSIMWRRGDRLWAIVTVVLPLVLTWAIMTVRAGP